MTVMRIEVLELHGIIDLTFEHARNDVVLHQLRHGRSHVICPQSDQRKWINSTGLSSK